MGETCTGTLNFVFKISFASQMLTEKFRTLFLKEQSLLNCEDNHNATKYNKCGF